MAAGERKRKREAPILFFLAASILVAALLLIDDVILYFFVESFFEMRPAFGLRCTVGAIFLLLNLGVIWLVFKARRERAQTGWEAMIGRTGVVMRASGSHLWVQVHGELWRAHCEARVRVGDGVLIENLDGLVLQVKPLA